MSNQLDGILSRVLGELDRWREDFRAALAKNEPSDVVEAALAEQREHVRTIAASVPEPHIGSISGRSRSQPDAITSAAARSSRSGALPGSSR